jgi:hypothetical protein
MPGRIDRGFSGGGEPPFSVDQRVFLLERDMDDTDRRFEEVKDELAAMRRLVTNRLNWIVGLGFSLLVSVVAVLVTVIASTKG